MPESSADSINHLTLDDLPHPLLLLSAEGTPLFLNAAAAKLLEVRDRHDLPAQADLLAPLNQLFSRLQPERGEALLEMRNGMHDDIRELELETRTGRSFKALAYMRRRGAAAKWLCAFQDLTSFEPFFRAIEQSRKNRAVLLLVSSYLGRSLTVDARGQGITSDYQAMERAFFENVSARQENWMQTDLLPALSLAVDIIDPLIPNTTKILLQAKTSALLGVSQPNFLRIVSHLLLEAADFVGPFGAVVLKANLSTSKPSAEIAIVAERRQELPLEASPLELYLYRKYLPQHYKVAVNDGSLQENLSELRFGASGKISDEMLSDNLAITAKLASACEIELQLKRPTSSLLALGAVFTLAH